MLSGGGVYGKGKGVGGGGGLGDSRNKDVYVLGLNKMSLRKIDKMPNIAYLPEQPLIAC